MEKYFNLATFGTLVIFAVALYAIMYFTAPAKPAVTITAPAS